MNDRLYYSRCKLIARRLTIPLLVVSAAVALTCELPAEETSKTSAVRAKKLIHFGSGEEPDTSFMRKYIAEMEKTPFDGCVFHINYQTATGADGPFTWECWGTRSFREEEFDSAINDLKNTPFRQFSHNFLRFNTTPGKIDWFDDFSVIVNNARLAARIARQGRAAGILFDVETYEGHIFNYPKQRDANTRSWDEYATQVRQRGREIMRAFQDEFPDLTILMTWAHSLPYEQADKDLTNLPKRSYGLLAPFTDGLIDAAEGKTKIVDGYESAYGFLSAAQFAAARRFMTEGVLPVVGDSSKYRQVISPGFGIWMDYDWLKFGWDVENVERNYFTPEAFEYSVHAACQNADEYVWIFTQTPRWWSDNGKPVKMSPAYDQALRRAIGK